MPINDVWLVFDDATIRKSATAIPGVYELGYASNGRVAYIGSSEKSIRARLCDHIEKRDFVGVTHFRFRKTAPDKARAVESRLLLEYKKAHDGKLPRGNEKLPPEGESLGSFTKRLLWG